MATRRPQTVVDLDTYRREIAAIDRRIVLLLSRRWSKVRETMGFKKSRRLPLFDKTQEERVLARARAWAKEFELSVRAVDRLFRAIMEEGQRRAVRPDGTLRSAARRDAPALERSRAKGPRRSAGRKTRSPLAATNSAHSAKR
jgi:chorismate mutase